MKRIVLRLNNYINLFIKYKLLSYIVSYTNYDIPNLLFLLVQ